MADNTTLNAGSGGDVIHTDDLAAGTYKMATSKVIFGADGVNDGYWVAGAGTVGSTTGRVTLASDDPAVVALQIIDDWDESDRAKVNPIVGQAGVAAGAGAVEATVQRMTLASDDPAVALLTTIDADTGSIVTATEAIQAAVEGTLTVGSHEVTNAGAFAVQVDGDALTTLQAIAGYLDTEIASILTAVQLIDNIVSGNEAQVDIVAALPAGDNNIGNVDVVSLPGELSGPGSPTIDSYTSAAISASANTADQQVIAAPGANKQIWVYSFFGTADTGDGSIAFQDEDDTALTGVMPVVQNGGFAVSGPGNFAMPLFKVATNKALEIDTVTCGFKGTVSYAVVSV